MTSPLRFTIKPYIQPFERSLAFAELEALTGPGRTASISRPSTVSHVDIHTNVAPEILAHSLAYWESVDNGSSNFTLQVLREATVSIGRNGAALDDIALRVPFRAHVPLPSRRCLRYGPHGLHEYRGKFFPQLVRALINIGLVPKHGVVADPMCGSGTTLVESLLAGRHTLGLDLNPLSVRLSQAKCLLLSAKPDVLRKAAEQVSRRLQRRCAAPESMPYFRRAPYADQQYLQRWFPKVALQQLDSIVAAIAGVRDETAREFLFIALSNILRRVSWQKIDDLRVRMDRTKEQTKPIPVFLAEVDRSLRMLLAFLYQNDEIPRGNFGVHQGDARDLRNVWSQWRKRVDAVITSPPYATALPYLDTDRLSLCYLQMLTRPEHRQRDLQMIGNREITDAKRRHYWEYFEANRSLLPSSVVALIRRVHKLNENADVGFRRRNLSALLAKYFFDMREVLASTSMVVKPERPVYIVVGNNRTLAGGEEVEIKTADLLSAIAESVGYRQSGELAMEMLQSRDIFKRNAGNSETLLMFKAPVYS